MGRYCRFTFAALMITLASEVKVIADMEGETAYEGEKSLRIDSVGKFARYWIGHLKSTRDQAYVFSVYMKATQPDTRVDSVAKELSAIMPPQSTVAWEITP